MKMEIEIKSAYTLIGLMGYAADLLDIETILLAQETLKKFIDTYGSDEVMKAVEQFQSIYGKIATPDELVWTFIEKDSLMQFQKYWEA